MNDPIEEGPVPIPDSDEALLAECRVETFAAGGPGGQHQNRTESAVRLVHVPSGIRVVAREERSQHRNRARALERLREALVEHNHRPEPRKGTRIPRRERRKRLEAKRKKGQVKKLRRPPRPGED
ncbi:MAG: peptide chain release factor-like protein [Gemmatimonadota bacterium]